MKQEKEKEAEQKLKSLMRDMTKCIEYVGYLNPINKVYKLAKDLEYFPLAATLLTFNALMQLSYDPLVFNLQRKQKEFLIDGPHYIVGLITIFKQFHFNHYKKFILFLIHYIKTSIYANGQQSMQKRVLDLDASVTMTFLEELIKFDGSSREVITQNLGTFIFDYYKINS